MKKLNFNTEWNFIIGEVHKEKSVEKNLIKRELLFSLQLLLSSISNQNNELIYKKTKDFYLSL